MHKAKAVTKQPGPSAGLATSRAAPKAFQFVDANPLTEAEKSQNKILVRSNASNFHWRRVKKSSDTSKVRGVARKRQTNTAQAKSSRRAIAILASQDGELSSAESDQQSPKNEEESPSTRDTISVVGSDAKTESSHDPWTLIAANHHDPFETYPSDLPKEFVSPVLDQSKRTPA